MMLGHVSRAVGVRDEADQLIQRIIGRTRPMLFEVCAKRGADVFGLRLPGPLSQQLERAVQVVIDVHLLPHHV